MKYMFLKDKKDDNGENMRIEIDAERNYWTIKDTCGNVVFEIPVESNIGMFGMMRILEQMEGK